MNETILLFGSNRGNKVEILQEALRLCDAKLGSRTKTSSLYSSPAWGFKDAENFLNLAATYRTEKLPLEILEEILEIEKTLGRTRSMHQTGYAARTLDIDILFYGDEIISEPELTIPHPRLQLRKFALLPVTEICPDKWHPVLKLTLKEILEICPDISEVKSIGKCNI